MANSFIRPHRQSHDRIINHQKYEDIHPLMIRKSKMQFRNRMICLVAKRTLETVADRQISTTEPDFVPKLNKLCEIKNF